jgi:hypothetical protein
MRLEGRLVRDGRWWLAEIPILDTMTQGRTRQEAFEMVKDLVETMIDRPDCQAHVHPGREGSFEVSASDVPALVALLIRRARARSGRTLHEVARVLGSSSPNAYARYEQGRASPTVGKLAELLRAVDCELVLREKSA